MQHKRPCGADNDFFIGGTAWHGAGSNLGVALVPSVHCTYSIQFNWIQVQISALQIIESICEMHQLKTTIYIIFSQFKQQFRAFAHVSVNFVYVFKFLIDFRLLLQKKLQSVNLVDYFNFYMREYILYSTLAKSEIILKICKCIMYILYTYTSASFPDVL